MPASKDTLLAGRLSKRLRALGLADYHEYCDFLFSPEGRKTELSHLVDVITTHKTDFFRGPSHFSYLIETALPLLSDERTSADRERLKIWSAGCSTGEEPYSLAMVLAEVQANRPGFYFDILATDISTEVLKTAQRAVYPMRLIAQIPFRLRNKYLLKGKDRNNPRFRIVPELRRRVRFGRLNFMNEQFDLPEKVDIIFCRNVIIYFDRQEQKKLIMKLCRHLNRGGFLFLGHAESLHGYELPLFQVAPSVYRCP